MDTDKIAAEIYDRTVSDWPDEMKFYESMASPASSVLEIACGTGRVCLRLAEANRHIFGLDASPHMIEIARTKGRSVASAEFGLADMRSFQLGRTFDLVIVPGHSFQFMLGIEDQISCLHAIRAHLAPGARLAVHVDHQDLAWLGGLPTDALGALDAPSDVQLPDGRRFRIAKRWSYQRATQTASVLTRFQQLDAEGSVIDSATRRPVQLHCFFRNEMELLWQRAGFEVQALYGDFSRTELGNASSEMVWLLSGPQG